MTACGESVSLGAYLLGALSPDERLAMERHIAGCAVCQGELVQLAPLPGLLRHTPFEELPETVRAAESLRPAAPASVPPAATEPPAPPAPPPLPPARDGGRRRAPSRTRRALLGAGLAVAGAALGAGLYAGVAGPSSSVSAGHPTETMSATDPHTHVSATAALTAEAWGTRMDLSLRGLPAGTTCRLLVRSRDGGTETAGTWGSGYSSAATVPVSTSMSPQDISGMTVVTASGATLVTLP